MLAALLAGTALATALFAQTAPGADDPIAGTWTGLVSAPQGTAEICLEFLPGKDGRLQVTVTMPLMHTYRASFGPSLARTGDGYVFAPLDTRLTLDGNRLTGTFGVARLPVALRRGGSPAVEPPAPDYPGPPAPVWSRQLGSPTWASPVVAGDTIFVGTSDGRFHAADAASGKAIWNWAGPNRIDGRAAVSAGSVCFVDGKIELVCLNRHDGTLRWRFALHDEPLAGQSVPDNPTFNRRTATPLVLDDTIYCGSSDGGLYAINVATGGKLWRHDAKSAVYSGITAVDVDRLAFGCMDGSVVILNRHTRQAIHRFKAGGGIVTTPLFTGGRVVVGGRDYMLYGFNVADGSVAWKYSYWFSWIESTPQLADRLIYVGASDYRRVTALDPADGQVRWATDVRGMAWGTPAVTAEAIFIGTVAQNLPGTIIKHTGGIMALDRKTGAVKWQLLSPQPSENSFGGYAGSLALAGDRLIAVGFDGVLAAYPVR